MNLYNVFIRGEGYFNYVFAESRNRARALCVERNSAIDEYPNSRARLLARNVGGKACVVDDEDHPEYRRVVSLGFRYDDGEAFCP